MGFEIRINGVQEAMTFFDTRAKLINKGVAKAINHAGESVANYATAKAPRDTGRMSDGIAVTQKATEYNLSAIVAPKHKYAIYVEKGTRPHFPPVRALDGWAKRHNISPFAVARVIARRGTRPQPFMAPAALVAPAMVVTEIAGAIKNILEKA